LNFTVLLHCAVFLILPVYHLSILPACLVSNLPGRQFVLKTVKTACLEESLLKVSCLESNLSGSQSACLEGSQLKGSLSGNRPVYKKPYQEGCLFGREPVPLEATCP
jgi:hypothetical protein